MNTVDSLFAIIERAKKANPANMKIEYDETYHFPKLISIDFIERAADDEITHSVESFAVSGTINSSR